MDPSECWEEMRAAAMEGDMEVAGHRALDLARRLSRDGARPEGLPSGIGPGDLRSFAAVCAATVAAHALAQRLAEGRGQ